jgi:general secretion pathway protein L
MNFSLSIADLQRLNAGGQSTLRRFRDWWAGELEGLLPARIQAYLRDADRTLRVSLRGQRIDIKLRGSGGAVPLGELDLHDAAAGELAAVKQATQALTPAPSAVVVELPSEHVLKRVVNLPASTEERLSDVLQFEMDRFTPFNGKQVYFAYRVTGRAPGNNQITVQLVIARRSLVDRLLQVLDDCDLEVSAVTAAAGTGVEGWNLLPRELRTGGGLRKRVLPLSLGAALGVLLVTAMVLPLVSQQNTLRAIEGEIAELRPVAQEVAQTKDEIAALRGEQGFFASKRAAQPTTIQLLDEISRVVPDDTWLVRLEVRGTKLRIQGESEGASSLLALLEASGLIENATFSSPVTKNPRTSNDRFAIEAQIRPPEGNNSD